MKRYIFAVWVVIWALQMGTAGAQVVEYGKLLGERRAGELTFEPVGPGVLFGALDPAVKKWYVPQELYRLYGWRQWEYTNYAREHYKRYVDIALEGDYFYDIYGNFVTRGWLIYDWRQEQPRQFGSSLYKDARYSSWFDRVLIASDSKGQYRTALTIGDEIRTTLTPLTFSKPIFNGLQWDFQSDKYSFTTLFSRVNYPAASTTGGIPAEQTNNTTLIGMRGTAQIGGYVRVGATYVNAHTAQTLLESFQSNPLKGNLTTFQNSEKISKVIVRLSDDSPEDNEGGAALYMDDIVVHDIYGRTWRGSEHGFYSLKEGGFQRPGYLAADGDEAIKLTYDFTDPSYTGPDPTTIDKVTVEMVLANDYKVEWTSDRQINANEQPVFLLVDRAPGNVKDNSNQILKRYDYGLPTGIDIYGVTLEVNDFRGFNIYAEFDRNRQYRQYPNINLDDHETAITTADAWYVNISKLAYPWFVFGEVYNIDDNYTTTAFMASTAGFIDYEDKFHYVYELVDDNDDQDRTPDWQRAQMTRAGDQYVFPGWDENNDFKSDFNENDNDYAPSLLPDYEEPFLRYSVDRPEFLFGIDMNNNMWVDRFENDEEPDYPYKRDRRGYNIYGGVHITPDVRLTVGQVREKTLAEKKRNLTNYLLFTMEKDWPRIGKFRLFHNLKLTKDNIPDNLFQWTQPPNSRGMMDRVPDPLAARDTWITSSYVGFTYTGIRNLNIINKLKYDWWHQRKPVMDLRRDYRFFGLINKADYTLWLWKLRVQPRIKNEFRREVPADPTKPERKENTLLVFLIGKFPVLRKSDIELGLEYTIFNQLMDPVPPGLSDDYTGLVFALQLTNHVDYLGYRLTTQVGFRVDRRMYKAATKTSTTSFVTVYAGAE
ncbi:MAG TPA: hypothetical protein EYP17_00820 [Candidatus Latescibacteria bacterium]|nr:hypothetical protein [Candidatus Latescibacterota bacterium]